MEAKIEAPRPRTFGALLFVSGATLSRQLIHSSTKEVELLEQPFVLAPLFIAGMTWILVSSEAFYDRRIFSR